VKLGHIEKSLLVTLTLACVSGCSWFGSSEDSNTNINISAVEQVKHYCYGTKDKRWECEEQPSPTKINTEFNDPARNKEPSAPATSLTSNKKPAVATEFASNKLLSAPGSAYTVQLIAMKNLKPVLAYAKKVGIEEPLLATVLDNDQVWHLLLLGIYDNPQSANASKDLWIGTRVLKVEPWVRKLGPLQEAIERYLSER
jgi:septal ring-binding cell division protein DamX